MPRHIRVFFYGLFMDMELLVSKQLQPKDVEVAHVGDYVLRIGERATLVPKYGKRVYGVVCSLTFAELDGLYGDGSVRAYRPEAVLTHLASGQIVAALCYNLPEPPGPADFNQAYAVKLRAVAEKVGLPKEYVATLQ